MYKEHITLSQLMGKNQKVQNTSLVKSVDVPAVVLAVYYWGFILLRPILQIAKSNSTLILLGFVLVLLSIFSLNIFIKRRLQLNEALLMIFSFAILFILDVLLRNNECSYKYIYQFTYSGLIPVIFLSQVENSKKLLYYFSILSSVAFIIYAYDPIENYVLFGNYMDFGFNLAMPAFLGLFIGFHYFGIRWMFLLEVLCFIEILVFANRSALLSIMVFVVFYVLGQKQLTRNLWVLILISSCIGGFLYNNAISIIDMLYEFVHDLGYSSYALSAMHSYFTMQDIETLFSGRFYIWEMANAMIYEEPLFGQGMGSFEAKTGLYSHNIVLDIMLFYGIIGLIIFCAIISKSGWCLLKSESSTKVLGTLFCCLWFPKLLFSAYFYEDIGFWCFLVFGFIKWKTITKEAMP
ncbi:MAG: O-Antigen ligase [Firmicutes bacterium]|nr:O-Antigen ligase [Bacillota bacterium]